MSRIPYPDMATLSPEKLSKAGFPERPILNVTRMAMHAPDGIWFGHNALKYACIHGVTIAPRLREVLILRVAHLSNCAYELHHHLSISTTLGFTAQEQDDLKTGVYDRLTREERAVAQFTDEVVRDIRASDDTLAEARTLFGDAQVVEMIILIGSYMSTARMAQTAGLELDAAPVKSWADRPAAPKP